MSVKTEMVEEVKWIVFDLNNGSRETRRHCFIFDRMMEAVRFRMMADIDTTDPQKIYFGFEYDDLPEHVPMKSIVVVPRNLPHCHWYEDAVDAVRDECYECAKEGYLECSRL